jgi:sulfur carrier protein
MMNLTVNGEPRASASTNINDLWRSETEHLNLDSPKGYAIALNGALVRKDKWPSTTLAEGDRVEIVRAMQGG